MGFRDDMVKERVSFLSQDADSLRQVRGQGLYETLDSLGLTHAQYFRAMDTNVQDYCAQEFGVDLDLVTVDRFFRRIRMRSGCFLTLFGRRCLRG